MKPKVISEEYSILITTADNIGPKYPQIIKCTTNALIWIKNLIKSKCYLPIVFDDPIFYLDNKSKLTDILSDPYLQFNKGLIVNEKVKEIFSKHMLCEHNYYQIKVSHKDILHENYYVFQIIPNYNSKSIIEYIDIKESGFYLGLPHMERHEDIQFENLSEIETKRQELLKSTDKLQLVCFDFCKFYKDIEFKLDLFVIPTLDINIYISNTLKDSLLTEKISGIDILQTNKIQQ